MFLLLSEKVTHVRHRTRSKLLALKSPPTYSLRYRQHTRPTPTSSNDTHISRVWRVSTHPNILFDVIEFSNAFDEQTYLFSAFIVNVAICCPEIYVNYLRYGMQNQRKCIRRGTRACCLKLLILSKFRSVFAGTFKT